MCVSTLSYNYDLNSPLGKMIGANNDFASN